jgi:hypothetical protein
MKYDMDLIWRQLFEVEAETPQEALAKAQAIYPNHSCDFIGDEAGFASCVINCDGCGSPMLDDEIASRDVDQGNDYCVACTGAIEDDRKNAITP